MAEQHAAEDARRREEAELKNRADQAAYAAEKLLRERGHRLPSEVKLEIDNQAQAVREALERAVHRAGQVVYGAAAGTAGGTPGRGPGTPPGTVEGEYREV